MHRLEHKICLLDISKLWVLWEIIKKSNSDCLSVFFICRTFKYNFVFIVKFKKYATCSLLYCIDVIWMLSTHFLLRKIFLYFFFYKSWLSLIVLAAQENTNLALWWLYNFTKIINSFLSLILFSATWLHCHRLWFGHSPK